MSQDKLDIYFIPFGEVKGILVGQTTEGRVEKTLLEINSKLFWDDYDEKVPILFGGLTHIVLINNGWLVVQKYKLIEPKKMRVGPEGLLEVKTINSDLNCAKD